MSIVLDLNQYTTQRFTIYNTALRELGERRLASLSEATEPRRLLDDSWAETVEYCLEQGHWKFAQRSSQLTYNPAYAPAFGFRRQFDRPLDCRRIGKVCLDEYFNAPLTRYEAEGPFWFADVDNLYVSYVSDDTTYGGDVSRWPATFTWYVALSLASRIVKRLTQNTTDTDALKKETHKALVDARSKAAAELPTQFLPAGSWTRARHGNGYGYGDRGSKSNLIG